MVDKLQQQQSSKYADSSDQQLGRSSGKSMPPPPFQLRASSPIQMQMDEENSLEQQNSESEGLKGVFSGAAFVGPLQLGNVPDGYAPNPTMTYSRHVLSKANFFPKSAGNSLLVADISQKSLMELYIEAAKQGIKDGNVTLRNGQTWYINAKSGKFFPVAGNGIINLTSYEINILKGFKDVAKQSPEGAIAALQKQLAGRGVSTISKDMQIALEVLSQKYNVPQAQMVKAIGSFVDEAADVSGELASKAKVVSKGKPFRIVKWGGRFILLVAVAVDVYELYEADFAAKEVVKKAGAWGGSLAAGGTAAEFASPLLAGGPWGWAAYAVIVGGAGIGGYFAGEAVAETIYEWGWEEKGDE